jgi:integrase
MRRGELASLKRSKVDLNTGVIHVHWQRAVASGEVNSGVIEKEPKGKSRRSIAMGPTLLPNSRRRKPASPCPTSGPPYATFVGMIRAQRCCGYPQANPLGVHPATVSPRKLPPRWRVGPDRAEGGSWDHQARVGCWQVNRIARIR